MANNSASTSAIPPVVPESSKQNGVRGMNKNGCQFRIVHCEFELANTGTDSSLVLCSSTAWAPLRTEKGKK
jgi:hypothetical protein